ncbi:hypothetical protein [Chromobacterium amazonense]|uniref:hypothetical protein n=1 Tax=Chromobacterium amazonense TaxID=1382803 RepID=UPI0011144D64|nr:hypothetical protein [Chromobacterium amazonense]
MKVQQAKQCIACDSTQLRSSPAILMPFVSHRALGWAPALIDESWGLRSISNGHAYALCLSVYCPNCELLFSDIRFDDQQMASLYFDYRGEAYTSLRDYYEPGYASRNLGLSRPLPYLGKSEEYILRYGTSPLSVLDWGGMLA